ncbi:MAG: DUF5662 family protein [Atribacterota bacterium]
MNKEMKNYFINRTNNHINCVRRNIDYLVAKNDDLKELLDRKLDHDNSKFIDPEFIPYIYITWNYKCKDDGIDFDIPNDIKNKMDDATNHHINEDKHHPEYWDKNFNKINTDDRDEMPDKSVNAEKMDDISLAEMICDWHAVSLERGGTTKEWADKNIGSRWIFSDEQIEKIYKFIDDLKNQDIFKLSFKKYMNIDEIS